MDRINEILSSPESTLRDKIVLHHKVLRDGNIEKIRKWFEVGNPSANCSDILDSLRRRKLYKPIDDNLVRHCYRCAIGFSLFNRRHHCRACGRIFCGSCSNNSEIIPRDIVGYISADIPDIVGRVCIDCKMAIADYRKIESLVTYFEIVAFPLDLCAIASGLCREWREAMKIYLSNFRDLQYMPGSYRLKKRDIDALKSNKHFITSHAKWMLQYLRVDPSAAMTGRTRSCRECLCDGCFVDFTVYDAIIIINGDYDIFVKIAAIDILRANWKNGMELFLPINCEVVQGFVMELNSLFVKFFWLSHANDTGEIFRNKLLLANIEQASDIQESIKLTDYLVKFYDNNALLSSKLKTLQLPFMGPFCRIDRIDNIIETKNSATKPIIIKYVSHGIKRAFMFKKEDIRKDAHLVSLIAILHGLCADIIPVIRSAPIDIGDVQTWFSVDSPNESSIPPDVPFQKQEQELMKLVSYQVLPSSASSGYIEIVPNALTLCEILRAGTISNYLYRNVDCVIGDIRVNYSASLAFWTVITYLLGIGDRHLENIMIRDDGVLFHIDYGFVFGRDSIGSVIRIDAALIEGLGGQNMYYQFKQLCGQIYCRLRKSFDLVRSCLAGLVGANKSEIEEFITNRFLPGQGDGEAISAFSAIIDANNGAVSNTLSDTIHSTFSSLNLLWG